MNYRSRVIACAVLLLAACGGSPPASGGGAETINGSERFGWDQPAPDAGELASYRYAIYVDDTRSEASDVSCAAGQTGGRFVCTASLPAMSAGAHTLQVASFVTADGAVAESARSAALRVVKR